MNPNPTSEIILVRHGETTGESSIRLNGRTDVPLSDLGRRQALRVEEALRGIPFDRVVVSPLVRSREMGRLVHPESPPEHDVVPGFLEIDFGTWETLTVDEVREQDPEAFRRWEENRNRFQYPNGESVPGFRSRIREAALATLGGSSGRTLAVLHKGVIKGILAALLGSSFESLRDYSVELGSIHRLERHAEAWKLVSASEVAHLGEDRSPEAALPGDALRSQEEESP